MLSWLLGLTRSRVGRALAAVLLVTLALCSAGAMLRSVAPELSAREGTRNRPVRLPWTFDGVSRGRELTATFVRGALSSSRVTIIPDDELKSLRVNDVEVPLGGVPASSLTDYRHGVTLDLKPWLRTGDNQLKIVVANNGGPGGVHVKVQPGARLMLVGVALLPLVYVLARLFGLTRPQLGLLVLGLLASCAYWSSTEWFERTYDAHYPTGHMGYVQHVAEQHRLPDPAAGWSFYHPPLYYVLGAVVRLAALHWRGPVEVSLQGLSLLLWLVFVASTAGALRIAMAARRHEVDIDMRLTVATALVVLWPSAALHSVRVGNDAAFFASAGVAGYFFASYWQDRRPLALIGAAAGVAFSLASKSNGAILLLALVCLVVGTWRQGGRPRWFVLAAACAVLGVGLGVNVLNKLLHYQPGKDWLVANANDLDAPLRVDNTLANFLPLDIPTFLDQPWMYTRGTTTARDNLWNFLLRSSISGEFAYDATLLKWIARAQGLVLLLLVLALLPRRWSWAGAKRTWHRQWPWLILALGWLSSLAVLRWRAPYSCSADFRYVLPILLPLALALSMRGRVTLCLQALLAVLSLLMAGGVGVLA